MTSVFNSLYAEQYDRLYAEKDYQSECDLVEKAFALVGGERPKSLLDVGCGTGKHAVEFAKRGYSVVGVDLSESMLSHARTTATALPPYNQPKFICGDARDFECTQKFDSAIMMFAVIGYLTENEDAVAAFRNIRDHLEPGAPFACDFWYGPSVLSTRPSNRIRVLDYDGLQVIRSTETTLDPTSHTADVSFRVWEIVNGEKVAYSMETHKLRYFFPQEMKLILELAGFEMKNIAAFPTLDKKLSDDSWNAFVVARAR